jgi:hypothetical protein
MEALKVHAEIYSENVMGRDYEEMCICGRLKLILK